MTDRPQDHQRFVDFPMKQTPYEESTDQVISNAEHWYAVYVDKLHSMYGEPQKYPLDELAKLCELSCQIAKARGLRRGL